MAIQETGIALEMYVLEPQIQEDGTIEVVPILIGTVLDGHISFPDEE
jgi:hypothetical protein